MRAELQTARELGEQLLTLAQHTQDLAFLLEAHRALGTTFLILGELVPARTHLEQGIARYDPQQHRAFAFLYGQDPRVTCLGYLAWDMWVLGYPEQALQSIYEARALAQGLSHPFSLAFALSWASRVHLFRREWSLTQERAEELMALCREQGFTQRLAEGIRLRGWALAEQGRTAEGIIQMQQGLTAGLATGALALRPNWLALIAEACGKAGQIEEGLRVVAEGLAAVSDTGERFWESELYRLQGVLQLALSMDNQAEVETCFWQALDIARRQQAKSLELRATMSLSRLWQRQGKRDAARQLLAEVYDWFTEGFDTADLQEAKALLAELT